MLMHKKKCHLYSVVINLVVVAALFFSACSPAHQYEVDKLNSQSYALHYRNLDSTKVLAKRALALSGDYPTGYAEACNNLAFVAIAKMDYKLAKQWLNLVEERSDNQIELLIADVQNMRLCQREARNKDFYAYREKAMRRLRRIGEETDNLPPREYQRAVYAQSEFAVVASTYFYYVQLEKPMMQALNQIDPDALEQDTAQYLNYLYNYGSGGAITHGTQHEILQAEFDMLIRCYMLASGPNPYPYWQANALQAISEHIQDEDNREFLIRNNLPAFQYLNIEQMPADLLAGNFAQRALNLFSSYGDVYQTAGAHRTLAECYWQIRDYQSSLDCLNHALYDNHGYLPGARPRGFHPRADESGLFRTRRQGEERLQPQRLSRPAGVFPTGPPARSPCSPARRYRHDSQCHDHRRDSHDCHCRHPALCLRLYEAQESQGGIHGGTA
jgi:hypothetical protein